MADREFMRPVNRFMDWFISWPGTTFHHDIEIVDLRAKGAGRGIIAKADIETDTVLFTIPRSAVLCSATSELSSLIPSITLANDETNDDGDDDGDGDIQDPWTSLILIMIFEFLRGSNSPWKPYLDMLPAKFDTPMFWSANELNELQTSPVVERIGRAEADEMIKTKVLPVIRSYGHVFFPEGVLPLTDEDLARLAHRMGSTILAYSFSLENGDDSDKEGSQGHGTGKGEKDETGSEDDDESGSEYDWVEDKDDQLPLGMIPMADMLNADAEFNAHINHGTDALTATAVRSIKAGEEILNYYGPLSNGELMRRYGYTTAKHEYFDAVDLPWKLVQDAVLSKIRASEHEIKNTIAAFDPEDLEDHIMIDREFDEDEESGCLKAPQTGKVLSELPSVLRKQTRAFVKRALREQKKSKQTPSKEEQRLARGQDETLLGLTAIHEAITARLATYPTSLQEDLALWMRIGNKEVPVSSRLRMALQVRIGEKRLLSEATTLAREMIGAYQGNSQNGSPDQQRQAKRQKTKR